MDNVFMFFVMFTAFLLLCSIGVIADGVLMKASSRYRQWSAQFEDEQ